MKNSIIYLAATFLVWGLQTGSAQENFTPAPTASLTVLSDPAGASLLINGREAGRTPLTLDSLAPGSYIVHLVNPEPAGWLTTSVTDTLNLPQGEVRSVEYRLRTGVLVNTVPSGASLLLDDSLAGVTPLILRRHLFERVQSLTLSLAGHDKVSLPMASIRTEAVTVPLTRRWTPETGGENPLLSMETSDRRTLPAVLSGIGAILAGATAAHLKIEADDRTEAYRRTQDAGLLAQRDRLDRAAAISLIVMQVGIGVFMYLLFSE